MREESGGLQLYVVAGRGGQRSSHSLSFIAGRPTAILDAGLQPDAVIRGIRYCITVQQNLR